MDQFKFYVITSILIASWVNAQPMGVPSFENGILEHIVLDERIEIHRTLRCSALNANSLSFKFDSLNHTHTLKSLQLVVLEPSQDESYFTEEQRVRVKLINIPSVNVKYTGIYTCTARNEKGSSDKIFNVTLSTISARTSTRQGGSGSSNVIAGVSVTIVVVTLIVVWIFYEFFGSGKNGLTKEEIQDFLLGNIEAIRNGAYAHENANYMPYKNTYEVQQDKLYVDRRQLLGSGQYGEVFIGRYNGKTVAVKTVKPNSDKMYLKSLLAELKIMIYLGPHPHIVGLVGASTSNLSKGRVYVIVECCELGSLEKYLRDRKTLFVNQMDEFGTMIEQRNSELNSNELCTKDLILWSYQLATAMNYLGTKKVIHGDLATRNVLVSNRNTVKITDFGLSRQLYDYTPNYVKQNLEPLPWRWMAYESLRELTFSNKSDVWSYGVTMWEMFTIGDTPFAGLFWTTSFVDSLANGERLEKPKYMTHDMYCEILKTWNLEPDKRINFENIAQYLQAYLEKF